MTRDEQVRELFFLLSSGISLCLASLKTGMDEKTAPKYRKAGRMPSELSEGHDWRTRVDPFAAVWPAIKKQLAENRAYKPRHCSCGFSENIRPSFRMTAE